MKMPSKKTIAAFVAGTFIIAGAASPFLVQAATPAAQPAAHQQKQVDPAKVAARISATYGVSQLSLLRYNGQGYSFQDLRKASFLAMASGKSLDDVMSLKTADNTWKDVKTALKLTNEQLRDARYNLAANRLNQQLSIDKQHALDLLKQGYRARDIAMAGVLAPEANKSMEDVLALKKINNTWKDVAASIGIDQAKFKQDAKKVRQAFPEHHVKKSNHKAKAKNKQ